MFGGLFGRKKEKKMVRKDPQQKKAEVCSTVLLFVSLACNAVILCVFMCVQAMAVLNQLQLKYETDEKRIAHLDQEMKQIKLLLLKEKKKKKPDMRFIKRHLNSLKLKDKQMATYDSYLISVQKQIHNIQAQMSAAHTVELMKQTSTYIKANQPNVEEVEDVTSDLAEAMEDLDEVNNLIAEHGSTELEDEDVMDELENLLEGESEEEEEDVDVDLPEPKIATGSHAPELPAAPTTELPAVAQPAAAAPAPARVPVAVGTGGSSGGGDDEAELAAWFS